MNTRSHVPSLQRLLPFLCLGLAVSTLGACRSGRAASGAEIGQSRGGTVTLEVDNRHDLDATIFVIAEGGQAQRVGLATMSRSTLLHFPARLVDPARGIRLRAEAVGSPERLTSEPVIVRSGQRIVWTLERRFQTSSTAVW